MELPWTGVEARATFDRGSRLARIIRPYDGTVWHSYIFVTLITVRSGSLEIGPMESRSAPRHNNSRPSATMSLHDGVTRSESKVLRQQRIRQRKMIAKMTALPLR